MKMTIIEDQIAQSDFGYEEVKDYHIYVKSSVYKQLLKQEFKSPKNWLRMSWSVFRWCISLVYETFFNACLATIGSYVLAILWFSYANGQVLSPEIVLTQADVALFVSAFYQWFMCLLIISLTIKTVKLSKGQVYSNIFNHKIFCNLQQQAYQLEAKKLEAEKTKKGQ